MNEKKTFETWARRWMQEKAHYVKQSTTATYQLQLEKHLLPRFGTYEVIREEDVQQFVLDKIQAGLRQKTIKDVVIILKMILRYGAKHGAWVYSPMDIHYPSTNEQERVQVLSREDQHKVMSYIEEHFTFKNLGILICLNTGLRIGELCALRWEDVNIQEGFIQVRRAIQRIYMIGQDGRRNTKVLIDSPKTKNSIREIPISRGLIRMLKPLKRIANPEYYILTNEAFPTEPRTYREYYKRFIQELHIPYIKFHGLRHSFATRCIESKCDYKTVSVLLGHANISTTLNLYVHPNLDQKRRCIEQMTRTLHLG